MTAIHIYRIADGRLAEHWVNRDDLGMCGEYRPISGGLPAEPVS